MWMTSCKLLQKVLVRTTCSNIRTCQNIIFSDSSCICYLFDHFAGCLASLYNLSIFRTVLNGKKCVAECYVAQTICTYVHLIWPVRKPLATGSGNLLVSLVSAAAHATFLRPTVHRIRIAVSNVSKLFAVSPVSCWQQMLVSPASRWRLKPNDWWNHEALTFSTPFLHL